MSSATYESINPSNAAQIHQPAFEVGDEVRLDTGEEAVIVCVYRDFAWVFVDREGFETVEISELRRPDPSRRSPR